MRSDRFSVGLAASAAGLSALLGAAPARTQDAAAAADVAIAEVVVTGSRIQTTGMQAPTPVTVLSQDALQDIAPGNVSQAVAALPQFFNNTQPSTSGPIGAALGATTVNLRGLGPNRTLTLMNGRRMVPFNQIGTVDISMFPSALTQRIDVVTGGASAAYGTDAVGGVVNFILDTKFTGLDLRGQGGISDRGDNGTGGASVAFGTQLTDRIHVLGSIDYNHSAEISSYKDRDWFRSWGLVTNPANPLQLLVRPDVVSTVYTCGGLINQPGSSLDRLEFLPDGTTAPFRRSTLGTLTGQGSQSVSAQYGGGSGCDVKAQDQRANSVSVLPETNRVSGFLYSDFALTENTKLFVQGLYGYTHLESNGNSLILQGTFAPTIYSGNPFLPANVQQVLTQTNLPSFGFARYGTAADIQQGRIAQNNRTVSLTTGFESTLPGEGLFGGWKVNGYYQFGRNENHQIIKDFLRIDRVYLALDAVRNASGQIVCNAARVNPAAYGDCVPLNLFGAGRASPEAIDYILGPDRDTDSVVTEHDVELAANGKLFEGWAGPIEGAFGLDYRRLKLDQRLKPVGILDQSVPFNNPALGIRGIPSSSQGIRQVYQFSTAFDAFGTYDVKEAFAEVRLPLLANMTAVQSLDLDLSGRLADYSGSGEVWAYKAGLNWQMFDELRFRGTWSRDVRAATLQERFNNQGAGGAIRDPLLNNLSYTPTIFTGGNPNVNPEEADTLTIGTVYQPAALPGFSASLDWYDIEVNGAIGQLSAQDIVNQCGLAQTGPTCSFIQRDPASNQIRFITAQYININKVKVSGVDLELGYTHPVTLFGGDNESLAARLFGTYLKERSQEVSGSFSDDAAGDVGAGYPRYRGQATLAYTKGAFKTYLREQYISGGLISRNYVPGSVTNTNNTTIDLNRVPRAYYTDLHFTYSPESQAARNMEIYFNIDNLLDKSPPVVPGFSAMGGSTPTNTGLYDQIGRRYLLGVHMRL